MQQVSLILISLILCSDFFGHDTYEITLEIQEKRKTIEVELEMARSTGVAATDPAPSNGYLFDPSDFLDWQEKFTQAAPELIRLSDAESDIEIQSIKTSLSREDDIQINYVFTRGSDENLTLSAPILNRFPPEGFGIRVSYRDRTGFWHPPFMILVDQQTSALPPE